MPLISRREVLSLGVTASALAFFPQRIFAEKTETSPIRATPVIANDLFSINLASDSPALDRLFPGISSDAGFQQFLPVSFLVSNLTKIHIRAFSSRWTLPTTTGEYEMAIMHYFHPRAEADSRMKMVWGHTGNTTYITAGIPAIKAGETRLVTPFFSWSPSLYASAGRPTWEQISLYRQRPMLDLSQLADKGSAISMKIDAAITHNFISIGPNDEKLAKVICVTRNAEHDQAVSVRDRITAGASSEQVSNQLLRDIEGLDFHVRPDAEFYFNIRQRQAKVLLECLKGTNWELFLGTLQYLSSQPKTRQGSTGA